MAISIFKMEECEYEIAPTIMYVSKTGERIWSDGVPQNVHECYVYVLREIPDRTQTCVIERSQD